MDSQLAFISNIGGGLCMLPGCLIGLAMMAFWIWILVEVITKEPAEDKDKMLWVIVVVLAGGIGALIYLLVRRPKRIQLYGR